GFEVVCKVAHDTFHRSGGMDFGMDDVPACMCTQLVFGNVAHDNQGRLSFHTIGIECKEALLKYKCLKRRYPHLKIIVEYSTWRRDSTRHLVDMHESQRQNFIRDILKFIVDYGFDGLSVYIGGEPFEEFSKSTKDKLVALMKELSAAFKPAGKLLSATFRGTANMQDFAKEIEPYVDFIHVLAFRMRQNDFKQTGIHTQLHPLDTDPEKYKGQNIETYVRTLAKVVPKHKLLPILAFSGVSFRLASSDKHGFYDETQPGRAYAGPHESETRVVDFLDICRLYDYDNWSRDWNDTYGASYVYKHNDWIAYDDARSIRLKMAWLLKEGVGGVVASTIGKDDFRGVCGAGPFPLLGAI
ncbi:unnamed protein product, partial [Ixodes hexagonus]